MKKPTLSRSKQLLGNQPTDDHVDETSRIVALLTINNKTRLYSEDRKARVTELMGRSSFERLAPEKQARMSRRLMNASRETTTATDFCEQLHHRLAQLTGRS